MYMYYYFYIIIIILITIYKLKLKTGSPIGNKALLYLGKVDLIIIVQL